MFSPEENVYTYQRISLYASHIVIFATLFSKIWMQASSWSLTRIISLAQIMLQRRESHVYGINFIADLWYV